MRAGDGAQSARWDEDRCRWRIRTEAGAEFETEALIVALGQLNRPKLPDIPGRDSFAGPAFHSARWDHSVPLEGKRVGVIGSAASAVQLIPEVAKVAGHLTVFQRTPNWLLPRMDREITEEEMALLITAPHVGRTYARADLSECRLPVLAGFQLDAAGPRGFHAACPPCTWKRR